MAKKNISDYMPEKRSAEDTVLVQAKIGKTLVEQFKPVLKSDGRTLKAFIEASMRKFIDERRKTA